MTTTIPPVTAAGSSRSDDAVLFAVCDALTLKALEQIGKRIARADRARFRSLADQHVPIHAAHTLWPTDPATTGRVLRGAFDVLPALAVHDGCAASTCADDVAAVGVVLRAFVEDLCISGRPYRAVDLAARLARRNHP